MKVPGLFSFITASLLRYFLRQNLRAPAREKERSVRPTLGVEHASKQRRLA